jgi:hypothetical protein
MAEIREIKVGNKVRCISGDIRDDMCNIPDDSRWVIGEEFIVTRISKRPWGTFLYNGVGNQNLDIKRAELVEEENSLSVAQKR